MTRCKPRPSCFQPLSPEVTPTPTYYHRLREIDPAPSALGFFVARRHADVSHVPRDSRYRQGFVGRMTRRLARR
jgi:hypothetical protein